MVSKSEPSNALRETLSSLMDGELPVEAARSSCSQWRADAQARDAWHTYHLIGDVLRSEDLASTPVRDEAFLRSLRSRLAAEPVPMAPLPSTVAATARADARGVASAVPSTPAVGQRRAARRFAPVALAASVVVVAGVVGVMRVSSPGGAGAETAQVASTLGASGTLIGGAAVDGAMPVTMLRDARLDRYMAAHRKLANGIAVPDRAGYQVQAVYESK